QRAVTGLTNASTGGRCSSPLGSLGSAMHSAASAAVSLFAGSAATGTTPPAPQSSVAQRATKSSPAPRPKSAASPKSAGGASPRVRSAGITPPQRGGIDWLLIALLFAGGATAVWLIYPRRRPHLERAAAGARSLGHGAAALAGTVGLVALRGASRERRR